MGNTRKVFTPEDLDQAVRVGNVFGYEPSVLPSAGTFAYLSNLFAAGYPDATAVLIHGDGWRHWRTIAQLKECVSWIG